MAGSTAHPFLDPLWRRVVLVMACAAWCVAELLYGTPIWAALVGAVTIYGAYAYLYAYAPSTACSDKVE